MTSECLNNETGCADCLKKNISLFRDLDRASLNKLNKSRRKLHYKKGEFVFKQNERSHDLICVSEGKVKLVKPGKIQDEFIIGFKKPVEFMALNDLFMNQRFSSDAIALEPVSICAIDRDALLAVMEKRPDFSLNVLREVSHELSQIQEKLVRLSQDGVEPRLVKALFEVENVFGTDENGFIDVELKRREIASIANMNTANVIRYLGKFEKDQLIEVDKRKIRLKNREALEAILNDNVPS